MASEFAMKLVAAALSAKDILVQDTLDAELVEVREVLEQFEEEWMKPHEYEHEIEVIPRDVACDQCELVKRARAFYEKLVVR